MPPLGVRAKGVAGWPYFVSSVSPSGPSTSSTRTPETCPVTMPTPDQAHERSSSCVAGLLRYGASWPSAVCLLPSFMGIGHQPPRRYSAAAAFALLIDALRVLIVYH